MLEFSRWVLILSRKRRYNCYLKLLIINNYLTSYDQFLILQELLLPRLLNRPYSDLVVKVDPRVGTSLACAIAMIDRIRPNVAKTQILCVCVNHEAVLEMHNNILALAPNGTTIALSDTEESSLSNHHCWNAHIIIGTGKGVLKIIDNLESLNDIKLLLLDDADIIATISEVKTNLIEKLSCQKIAISSVFRGQTQNCLANAVLLNLQTNKPLGNCEVFVSHNSKEKNKRLDECIQLAKKFNRKVIIFCNVSVINIVNVFV